MLGIFCVPVGHLGIFAGEMVSYCPLPIFNLCCRCMRSLYVWGMKPLSDTWFANIFPTPRAASSLRWFFRRAEHV